MKRLPLLCGGDGFANAFNGIGRLLHDERRVEIHDAVTHTRELPIAALVQGSATVVPKAVDFHDDTHGWREAVDYVTSRETGTLPDMDGFGDHATLATAAWRALA